MDEQNKGMNERWAEPGVMPERGYASENRPAEGDGTEARTREIRSEIDQTRADMSETIDAIQERLRPGNIVSHATESVRDKTVGKVKEMANSARERFSAEGGRQGRGGDYGVVDRIRENPLPAAIAAASIAWIAFSGRRRAHRTSPAIYGSTRGGDAFIRETVISEDPDEATELGPYSAGGGYGSGRSARDVADEATERARAMVRGTGTRMRRASSTAQTRVQRFVSENPLAAGAVAAAIGATVGLALPETRRENELMGETRDTVVNRAQEAARDAAERVQDAAGRVGEVAGDAARSLGREE
jgi:ElaB/YqjD/DUF883 family membrane-anchored ribosome-binding protein